MEPGQVFVTPLEDGRVEVETDDALAAGRLPEVVENLRHAALVVVTRYPTLRPVLLFEEPESEAAQEALRAFRQAQRDAAALIQLNQELQRDRQRRNPLTGHFIGGGRGE